MKRVVLLGGGHSHLEVVRRFGAHPVAGVEVSLVDPSQFATYSGMLPGLIAGHYRFNECHVDLARLTGRYGVRFLQRSACGIDAANHQIELSDGNRLHYDVASINVGSTPPTAETPSAAEYAIPVKPFTAFAAQWDRLVANAMAGTLRNVLVIGGGAAGVELVLAMHHRVTQAERQQCIEFAVVTGSSRLLPDHNPQTRAALERALVLRGIGIRLNCEVIRVETEGVVLRGTPGLVASDATIWATGAGAPAWLSKTGLALDAKGFLGVDESLASLSTRGIFAAGDCATIEGHHYPKSGVYAVRQGPVLAENLRRVLAGEPLVKYRPQKRVLSLISTGERYAAASYGRFALEGAWVWRWKDYIDRKFMRRYLA